MSAGGRRPVVLLSGGPRQLAARLARAGFAVVTAVCPTPDDLGLVVDAVRGGALSVEAGARVAVLAADESYGRAAAAREVPWLLVPAEAGDAAVDAILRWLMRHLV